MALTSEKTTTDTSISAFGKAQSTVEGTPLNAEELRKIHAFWRACNYLAIGMIYLRDNPLLRSPLKIEQIKHRILGHWGSSPGLSFVYTHLNRLIKQQDLNMIFLAGPGHGAPGVLGPCYLEGTYSEIYPDKSEDEEGLKRFFKEFSFPGGIGSHCTPETPGSIHEGGELGYSVSHAYGAAYEQWMRSYKPEELFDTSGKLIPELKDLAPKGDRRMSANPIANGGRVRKALRMPDFRSYARYCDG